MTVSETDPVSRAVIVTGAGTGIGRATAQAFAAQGASVLAVGRTESTLVETARDHDTIHPFIADLTAVGAPQLIAGAARRRFGRIDVLVNNAAALGYRMLADTDDKAAQMQIQTNLVAPILLTRHVLDDLEQTRGTVVNLGTAGALGLRSWAGNGLYGAAKAGLDFLTRTWAVELAPRCIRVVGVAPGVVDTRSSPRMGLTDEEYDGFLADISTRTPAGRVGTPEEIAWWITQLIRPEAAYLTGAVVPVDGGLSLT